MNNIEYGIMNNMLPNVFVQFHCETLGYDTQCKHTMRIMIPNEYGILTHGEMYNMYIYVYILRKDMERILEFEVPTVATLNILFGIFAICYIAIDY